MIIGGNNFDVKEKCYVVGILNFTPDSFFDGGKFNRLDLAFRHAEQMVKEGASIIDVGGESTRPFHKVVSVSEEIERVGVLIRELKARFSLPISLDTRKSKVAEVGIAEGADLINDVSGLNFDSSMASVIAKSGVACCLGHAFLESVSNFDFFDRFFSDVDGMINLAVSNKIDSSKICIDPGIGFGKTKEQNLKILNKLDMLNKFKLPIFLGTSNKSFIGKVLNLDVSERLEGTLATTAVAVLKGASFVRVHDVKSNLRVVRMVEAIKKSS